METRWMVPAATVALAGPAGTPDDAALRRAVESSVAGAEALYRDLHGSPELSGQERGTAAKLADRLGALGFAVTTAVGGHGIVGVLRNGDGPVVMLRTDLDALPVREATGLPWASTVTVANAAGERQPVMHACGHDLHMTVWLGTLELLAKSRDAWRGTVLAVGQPDEEVGAGAAAMLRDGLFDRFPAPDHALAFHVSPDLPAGTVGFHPGAIFAGVTSVDVRIRGVGGHGATPHKAVDPVVLAARTVLDYQTIVSRELDPVDSAVVTVGSIHGGTRHNILPDAVDLQVSVRWFDDGVRDRILEALQRIPRGIAASAGLGENRMPVVAVGSSHPPVLNDAGLVERAVAAMRQVLGAEAVRAVPPVTVSEDFGWYGRTPRKVPIALFWLGGASPDPAAPRPPLHSPAFAPDFDGAYRTGVTAMTAAVLDLMRLRSGFLGAAASAPMDSRGCGLRPRGGCPG